MYKIGVILLLVGLIACKDKKATPKEEDNGQFDYSLFSDKFQKASFPYQLTDSGFLSNSDTITLRNPVFLGYIPDSIKTSLFGSNSKIKYTPLARLEEKEGDKYFIVKASAGAKKAALLMVFDKKGAFGAAFPLLQPDTDPTTTQTSTIDKSYSITKTIVRKLPDDVMADGKDVYIYNEAIKGFTLIMTDALDNAPTDLINPIDTLGRTNPFAGDYVKVGRNIVSIRDASNPKELNFFIHLEKEEEECTGELKGTALLTSSKTAVFRQGNNPCTVEFSFSGSTITIKEAEGCGSYRGIKCLFEGKFTKKKTKKNTNKKQSDS